ncbi:hypothetical protein HS088_TW02G00266 [Tripterygium wilfordii]|uniref:Uncharacterized protein n=1 Tax=Tripterygium wilfordii TaxID=458696 RepID=A0A7J7DY01_TRIWF|nr:hypothetical protein HS088_TW02G00266 [Tripterygium wilfordii]
MAEPKPDPTNAFSDTINDLRISWNPECCCRPVNPVKWQLTWLSIILNVHDMEEKDVKAPNIIERAKEEIEAIAYSPNRHQETHGRSEDIDKNTLVEEVKGPSVFQRVKEEFEAIAEAIHPKKKVGSHDS